MKKKEQILQATLKLIVQKGIQATPMSEIAKAANTGMGAIYNHFPNKESLINALYFYLKAKESAIIMDGYDATLSVKQRFIYFWKRMIHYFMEEPADFMFLEQFYYSPSIDLKAKNAGSLYVNQLDAVYLQGQQQEMIKSGNVREWIGFTRGSLVSLVKLHHNNNIRLNPESIDHYLQAAWDAIKS